MAWARQWPNAIRGNGDTTMRSRTKLAAGILVALFAFAAACSSDDDSSTSTSSTQGDGKTVAAEYETWCTSVQNLIDQSSPNDLSAVGDLAAFSQAIQSLATTAPAPIATQMQTLAAASQAKLEAVQQDPTATLPEAAAQQAQTAEEDVSSWIAANCGGLQLPEIDL